MMKGVGRMEGGGRDGIEMRRKLRRSGGNVWQLVLFF